MNQLLWIIIACGALSIVYGALTTRSLLASSAGNARMQEIAAAIQEGASAYLARQYTTIAIVGVVIFGVLAYLLSFTVAIGFLIGALLSGAAGFIGMLVSVRANVRTTQASSESLGERAFHGVQGRRGDRASCRRPRPSRGHHLLRLSNRVSRIRAE